MLKEKRVLIVDDEPDLVDLFAEFLPPQMKIFKANSEEAALNLLKEVEVDAVLCDISLGKGNGLRLLEKARVRKINVPFVMVTGDLNKENATLALRLGASDIIEKPVPNDYFETKLLEIIEEGYSLRRIKDGLGQVSTLIGKSKGGEMDFVKDYLAHVEANRLMKKVS